MSDWRSVTPLAFFVVLAGTLLLSFHHSQARIEKYGKILRPGAMAPEKEEPEEVTPPVLETDAWWPHQTGPHYGATNDGPTVIHLAVGSFDPLAQELRLPTQLRAAALAPGQAGVFLVQFEPGVSAEDAAELEKLGGRVLGYIPNNTYAVHVRGGDLDLMRTAPGVRWTGRLEPGYKISPALALHRQGQPSRQASDPVRLRVSLVPGIDPKPVIQNIERRGMTVRDEVVLWPRDLEVLTSGYSNIGRGLFETLTPEKNAQLGLAELKVDATRGQSLSLARLEEVTFLRPERSGAKPTSAEASQMVQSGSVGSAKTGSVWSNNLYWRAGLDGEGLRVFLSDENLSLNTEFLAQSTMDTGEPQISGNLEILISEMVAQAAAGTPHRKVFSYRWPRLVTDRAFGNPTTPAGTPVDVVPTAEVLKRSNLPPSRRGKLAKHGTHMASLLVGDRPGDDFLDGVAKGAVLGYQDAAERFRWGLERDLVDFIQDLRSEISDRPDDPSPGILNFAFNDANNPLVAPMSGAVLGWTDDPDATATQYAADFDFFSWMLQRGWVVMPTGNSGNAGDFDLATGGSIISPATSKNDITVGAHEQDPDAGNIPGFSGRGPEGRTVTFALGDRIGPTVVAPGVDVRTGTTAGDPGALGIDRDGNTVDDAFNLGLAAGFDDTGGAIAFGSTLVPSTGAAAYVIQGDLTVPAAVTKTQSQLLAGTSFAAAIAGGAAVLTDDYVRNFASVSGIPGARDIADPSGALIKALIVNSAEHLPSSGIRGNNNAGFGRINLAQTLPLGAMAGTVSGLVIDDRGLREEAITNNSRPQDIDFAVTGTGDELRCTLAWYDAPERAIFGGGSGKGELTNDLDLKLIGPDIDTNADTIPDTPRTYIGNDFVGAFSGLLTGNSPDRINNVEMIVVDPGEVATGSWRARVTVADTDLDGHIDGIKDNHPLLGGQPYALVCAGDVSQSARVQADRAEYTCRDRIRQITVFDNTSAVMPASVTVDINITAGDSLLATLNQTADPNIYELVGQIPVREGASNPADSVLQVQHAQRIRFHYTPVGGGSPVRFQAEVDCVLDVIKRRPPVGPTEGSWSGGCDNDIFMDIGETGEYTTRFAINERDDMSDVTVFLDKGPGCSPINMAVLDSPKRIGHVDSAFGIFGLVPLTSVTFTVNVATNASIPPQSKLDQCFTINVTSPADGKTVRQIDVPPGGQPAYFDTARFEGDFTNQFYSTKHPAGGVPVPAETLDRFDGFDPPLPTATYSDIHGPGGTRNTHLDLPFHLNSGANASQFTLANLVDQRVPRGWPGNDMNNWFFQSTNDAEGTTQSFFNAAGPKTFVHTQQADPYKCGNFDQTQTPAPAPAPPGPTETATQGAIVMQRDLNRDGFGDIGGECGYALGQLPEEHDRSEWFAQHICSPTIQKVDPNPLTRLEFGTVGARTENSLHFNCFPDLTTLTPLFDADTTDPSRAVCKYPQFFAGFYALLFRTTQAWGAPPLDFDLSGDARLFGQYDPNTVQQTTTFGPFGEEFQFAWMFFGWGNGVVTVPAGHLFTSNLAVGLNFDDFELTWREFQQGNDTAAANCVNQRQLRFSRGVYNAPIPNPAVTIGPDPIVEHLPFVREPVVVQVFDPNVAGAGSVQVNVASFAEPAGELVTLTEDGANPGLFTGPLLLRIERDVAGMLEVTPASDVLEATYDFGAGALVEFAEIAMSVAELVALDYEIVDLNGDEQRDPAGLHFADSCEQVQLIVRIQNQSFPDEKFKGSQPLVDEAIYGNATLTLSTDHPAVHFIDLNGDGQVDNTVNYGRLITGEIRDNTASPFAFEVGPAAAGDQVEFVLTFTAEELATAETAGSGVEALFARSNQSIVIPLNLDMRAAGQSPLHIDLNRDGNVDGLDTMGVWGENFEPQLVSPGGPILDVDLDTIADNYTTTPDAAPCPGGSGCGPDGILGTVDDGKRRTGTDRVSSLIPGDVPPSPANLTAIDIEADTIPDPCGGPCSNYALTKTHDGHIHDGVLEYADTFIDTDFDGFLDTPSPQPTPQVVDTAVESLLGDTPADDHTFVYHSGWGPDGDAPNFIRDLVTQMAIMGPYANGKVEFVQTEPIHLDANASALEFRYYHAIKLVGTTQDFFLRGLHPEAQDGMVVQITVKNPLTGEFENPDTGMAEGDPLGDILSWKTLNPEQEWYRQQMEWILGMGGLNDRGIHYRAFEPWGQVHVHQDDKFAEAPEILEDLPNPAPKMVQSIISLENYRGRTVKIRFNMTAAEGPRGAPADDSFADGYFLDDLVVIGAADVAAAFTGDNGCFGPDNTPGTGDELATPQGPSNIGDTLRVAISSPLTFFWGDCSPPASAFDHVVYQGDLNDLLVDSGTSATAPILLNNGDIFVGAGQTQATLDSTAEANLGEAVYFKIVTTLDAPTPLPCEQQSGVVTALPVCLDIVNSFPAVCTAPSP